MTVMDERKEQKAFFVMLAFVIIAVAALLSVLWIFGQGDLITKILISVGAAIMLGSVYLFLRSNSTWLKYFVFIVGASIGTIALVIMLMGCSSAPYTPPVDQDWITPSEVKVSNYGPGKEADGYIRIHNGDEATMQTERWEVITDPEETKFPICLKLPIADLEGVQVTSDNNGDSPTVAWYDEPTRQIGLSGFLPDAHRIITIKYEAVRQFAITVRLPDHCRKGYTPIDGEALSYVIVDATVSLQGRETLDVPIVLNVPEDIKIGDKPFEFWVTVMDANPGMIGTEMAQRWLINGE